MGDTRTQSGEWWFLPHSKIIFALSDRVPLLLFPLQGICGYFMMVLTFLSALLAVRLYSVGSFRGFLKLRLARQLIVFTLIDSWLFCWASAVILFGVGSSLNHTACEIGIWWCIAREYQRLLSCCILEALR